MRKKYIEGIGLCVLALTVLKLCGVIALSWLWVFAPVWLPLLLLWLIILAALWFGERQGVRNGN